MPYKLTTYLYQRTCYTSHIQWVLGSNSVGTKNVCCISICFLAKTNNNRRMKDKIEEDMEK